MGDEQVLQKYSSNADNLSILKQNRCVFVKTLTTFLLKPGGNHSGSEVDDKGEAKLWAKLEFSSKLYDKKQSIWKIVGMLSTPPSKL